MWQRRGCVAEEGGCDGGGGAFVTHTILAVDFQAAGFSREEKSFCESCEEEGGE